MELDGLPLVGSNDEPWPIIVDGQCVGRITPVIYSPRLNENIALAMMASRCAEIGTRAIVEAPVGSCIGEVVLKTVLRPKEGDRGTRLDLIFLSQGDALGRDA